VAQGVAGHASVAALPVSGDGEVGDGETGDEAPTDAPRHAPAG
jgi:hypothetical protein